MVARRTSATKKELLTELKGGTASALFVGKAVVSSDSFTEAACKEGKTWKHIRNSFGVNVGEGNTHYIRLNGGYKTDRPLVYVRNTDFEPIQIPWDERFNKEKLANVTDQDFIQVRIKKNAEGKMITKKFLSVLDVNDYLNENLENDAEVIVSAQPEYSFYNDTIYTNYNIKGIFLNEGRVINEVEQDKRPSEATLRQTYFLNEHSLSKNWQKELKENGFTVVNAFVPEYTSNIMSNGTTFEFKKVLPYQRQFKVELSTELSDENKDKRINVFKKFFLVAKGEVRQASFVMKLNEGYVETTGQVEITDEMQELIDAGIMTEEEVKQDVTIRGDRVSEVIFVKPGFKKVEESGQKVIAIEDGVYDPSALVFPDLNADEEDLEEDDGILFDESDFEDDDDSSFDLGGDSSDEEVAEEKDPIDDLFGDDIF